MIDIAIKLFCSLHESRDNLALVDILSLAVSAEYDELTEDAEDEEE